MKTLILAAVAAIVVATAASAADDFDVNVLTTTVTTGNLEFSADVGVGDAVDSGENFAFGVKGTVLSYDVFGGASDVNVYGQYGQILGVSGYVIGAEYVWVTGLSDRVDLELAADAAYVMPNGFDNELLLTPSTELTVDVTDSVAVFGGAGYTWVATDDFSQAGGYGELGLDISLTDTVGLRPSVIQPFDTGLGNEPMVGALEVTFDF